MFGIQNWSALTETGRVGLNTNLTKFSWSTLLNYTEHSLHEFDAIALVAYENFLLVVYKTDIFCAPRLNGCGEKSRYSNRTVNT